MNTHKHLLLDEFLEGRLSATERNKFLTKLESDADLRSLVEAERVIKQSVISDRQELEAVDHSATYSFLLAGLAATAATAAASTTTATAATKATSSKSLGATLFGGGSKTAILSLTVSVVASAAIGVATYQLRHSSEQASPPVPVHVASPAPAAPLPEAPVTLPAHQEVRYKKGIAQKQSKQTAKEGHNEVFHDIYGDVIESKNNQGKNPAPK